MAKASTRPEVILSNAPRRPMRMRPHGTRVRGADLPRSSPLFGGPFGRIFRALPPADFGADDAASLARAECAGAPKMIADPDPPKDGPDAEESGIPAAYTYLGQFIDHDLTFDPASSLQRQNDPDALVDFRTPRFDLDNVYGRGPDDQPYLYDDGAHVPARAAADRRGGEPAGAATCRAPAGQPPTPARAHRRPAQRRERHRLPAPGPVPALPQPAGAGQPDGDVRRRAAGGALALPVGACSTTSCPTIVSADVIAEVLPHVPNGSDPVDDPPRLRFYNFRDEPFMPLEFSVAAYRFGHSMVRPGYRLNETIGPLRDLRRGQPPTPG